MCERCVNPKCKGAEAVAALFATIDDPELIQLVGDTLERLGQTELSEDQRKHFAAVYAVVQELTFRFTTSKVAQSMEEMVDRVMGVASFAGAGTYQRDVSPRRRRPQAIGKVGLRRAPRPRTKQS